MIRLEYASPRLTVALVDDVHIAVHSEADPDAKDWEGYLQATRKLLQSHENVKALVYTMGGNPSGAQRAELNKINEGLLPRVSVMVESRIARGAVTALSWFNPSIKAYSLEQVNEAMVHLGLSGAKAKEVREALEELKIALRDQQG